MTTMRASRVLQAGLLAMALTGCPALDTTTGQDPAPGPSASQPPGEEKQEPTLEINTLGLVSATILEASFTTGPGRVEIYLDDYVPDLGLLLEAGETGPHPTPRQLRAEEDGTYQTSSGEDVTHTFHVVAFENYLDELAIALGGQAPTSITADGNYLSLRFPPGAKGALTVQPKEGSKLAFLRTSWSGRYTRETAASVEEGLVDVLGKHDATASITVSVRELDGTPCSGLKAANFEISEELSMYYRGPATIAVATESSPGRYQVTAAFSNLIGRTALPRKLILKVVNPRIEQEVTR